MGKWRDALSLDVLSGRQERFIAISMTVLYLGTGLSYSTLALYLVRLVHLNPGLYGAGTSVAAILGLASGPLMGRLSDRNNGHRLYATLVWLMCVATAAFIVATPWLALALLSVLMICGRGSAAVLGALIGRAVPTERRVRYRALTKTTSNTAMLIGLGLGSLVLALGTRVAFQASFAVEAVTFLLAGGLVWFAGRAATAEQVDPPRPGAAGGTPGRGARANVLRDGRFAALTLLNCVLTLYESMLTIALPLWVSARLHAPLWLVSVALVVNTTGTILLQIPASRRVSDLATAIRSGRTGAILLAVAAVMFPVTAIVDGTATAVTAVAVLALALVGGEVCYSAACAQLVYALAPQESLGLYLGVFGMGFDVTMMCGPALFGWLATEPTMAGWIGLAGVFLVAGFLIGPVGGGGRWARSGRPAEQLQETN